jgi:hypothetical protein
MKYITLPLLTLLLSGSLQAAESLKTEDLDKTFVPLHGSAISCAETSDEKADKTCSSGVPATTKSLTTKALRDAEHQVPNESLANPQRNNPEVTPLPTQLPPQEMSLPTPKDLMNMWNSRPPM